MIRVGPHLFACGDAEDGRELAALVEAGPPTLLYFDPPWNDALATRYRTMAGFDGPKGRRTRAADLLPRLLDPARRLGLLAYLESGLPSTEAVVAIAQGAGATITGQWRIYGWGRQLDLIAADFAAQPQGRHPDFTGIEDSTTPDMAFGFHPRGVVLDPCCGLGFTSRAAARSGWVSLNHELNPRRMAQAVRSLSRAIGAQAVGV